MHYIANICSFGMRNEHQFTCKSQYIITDLRFTFEKKIFSRSISVTVKVKADMKSYKSLEKAAIFYSSEPFLKQGIS